MNINEIEIKVDSAEKLASVAGKPTENFLFAPEFNAVVDKTKELDLLVNKDSIVTIGNDSVIDNDYTYNNYVWRINGNLYNNLDSSIVITINPVTAGFKRKDISYFDTNNLILKLEGIETDGDIVESPTLPPNCLLFKTYDVNDSGVTPVDALIGSDFVKKEWSNFYAYANSGSNQVLPLRPNGIANYTVTNSLLTSISGFDKSLLIDAESLSGLYLGKNLIIWNQTANPITLLNGTAAEIPFNFGSNLVIPSGEKILIFYDGIELRELFKSWSNIYVYSEITDTNLTGTTLETIMNDPILLPDYFINGKGILDFVFSGRRNLNNSSQTIVNVYINSSHSITGATLIGYWFLSTSSLQKNPYITREVVFNETTLSTSATTIPTQTEVGVLNNQQNQNFAISLKDNPFLILTYRNTNTADISVYQKASVKIYKTL
ncbi:hypothetical protein FIA58_013760 [Flavobacterium jejuense]|uniref:Virion structural protein n=1 Tax=Flavobacterium jejuense TaxID=1544455 RepID=A0ABX0IU58_9FLAO|nr:hypothetical protein [Flavobacterium jejuense]NHN26746.1 hypothetical protein [Flavobacterium jejuense]